MVTMRPRIFWENQTSDTVPMPSRCTCIFVNHLTPCIAAHVVKPADDY